ncbi:MULTISPECIES: DUF3443 domain-containing protein [Paraburkholderia]|uniref:DUF3443 domain-containing protein n=1 Tax=Paraburkholderia madseniana TaxID=2599607 RepID=A0AAP5BB24_9BURK|nr:MULTISPECIES: DUF3443 domain-containing protein [Paraburkholderia]MCX4144820.1 DUF3443 domain-containing protein [Paraburkholderia madseniana]MCX4174394.1 DUF3443 domain-containing protein [Paraburkholderia madseniana]MDN7147772.1 DUF3443 domain-containing protein [Paraburkholderia sp. WS6]MDQ6406652.1 DUF3443 domain-containing protein [Paraburkholderia madseniana]MDQ6462397.1 DUF3443 domain-containing protein [Paraburkholderia madseniana]
MRHTSSFVTLLCATLLALLVSACGGGGGGSGGSSSSSSSGTTSLSAGPTVTNTSPSPQVVAANAVRVTVDSGVSNVPNMPFVSITICAPGTSQCQTIDHILVDTGSWGVRVFASQLPASMALPQQKDASGHLVAECMQFFDGYTWGSVKLADLQIAGEKAASLPIQVIDPNYASVPSDCASVGASRNTPGTLQANGILGIGVFKHDCGANCVQQAVAGTYYGCSGTTCTSIPLAEALQVANPIPYFATDNNGSMLSLPTVSGGAQSVSGQLVFGIGTQANNALGSAQVIGVSASNGTFTTVQNGTTYSSSILDSGSTGLFFQTSALPTCASPNSAYYCPVSTQSLSAMIQGVNGTTSAVNFSVGNATTISQTYSGDSALPLLAGPAFVTSSIFDWGLPFFYGRNVYAAVEQQTTPGGTGPYVAY